MAKAHYIIQVPNKDELGNPLRVGEAAHQYLSTGPVRVEMTYLTQAHPHDVLHAHAEDHPKNDSHMKQLAAFISELANVPGLSVSKHGKNVQSWTINNAHYCPGEPAEHSAFQVRTNG